MLLGEVKRPHLGVEVADTVGTIGHDSIERSDDDRLGRRGFAELLAKALAGSPEQRNTVVTLYGDWGSGKTDRE